MRLVKYLLGLVLQVNGFQIANQPSFQAGIDRSKGGARYRETMR
jgi:hypothetical protein